MKVKTNDLWQTVSTGGGADEVWVTRPHPLPVNPRVVVRPRLPRSPDEVVIGAVQPTDVAANLWVKTNEANALYAKVSGSWTKLTGTVPEEVTVGTVQPTDPAAELWVKTNEDNALYAKVSGSWVKVSAAAATVPNEVHVSATDPIGTYPELELWVDSTAVSPLVDDARWNTAWGIVVVGSTTDTFDQSIPPSTWGTVTQTMSTTLVAGRNYKVTVVLRAIQGTGNVAVNCRLLDNGVEFGHRLWNHAGNYLHLHETWRITGSGLHTFQVQIQSTGA